MTIDKSALKALAEAATQGEWKFDGGTVNDWCDGEYSMEWMPNGEDCEDGTNSNWKADGAYIAAAKPKTILALLAEIEGLNAQHGRDSGELRKICSARDSALRERDQLKAENKLLQLAGEAFRDEGKKLKAENEDYRSGQDRYEQIIEDLKAENESLKTQLAQAIEFQPIGEACLANRDELRASLGIKLGDSLREHVEALRKDAERYRFLCDKFGVTKLPCAIERILAGDLYVADGKKSIDAAIDAAMSNPKAT